MIMIMVIIATWKAHMGGGGDYEGPSQIFELEIDTWLGRSNSNAKLPYTYHL